MTRTADVAIVGGGISGASLAARLAGRAKTIILEMEQSPGYHATGRSAAMFEPSFGPPAIRALTLASGPFLREPPDGFCETPLVAPRGVLLCAEPGDEPLLEEARLRGYADLTLADAKRMVPALRTEALIAALYDEATLDVDVDALHRASLRQHRRAGGESIFNARVLAAERRGGAWALATAAGDVSAPVVVNAAGAWADALAALFGLPPLGLQPKRRSAAIVPPPPVENFPRWPQVFAAREDFYCKPMGGKLMISPSDAEPMDPHDAFADDLVLAEGIAACERVLAIEVKRIERSWGGLRTFAPDGAPVAGYDPSAEGFFWLAGQGGYGIQIAPALSAVAATLLLGDQSPDLPRGVKATALGPARFRG
jgi:D-arginine dehydrogenase